MNYLIIIRDEVWQGIAYTFLIGIIIYMVPYQFIKDYDDKSASKMTLFSMWTFFVLINAYYGGAMTMFFVSEISLPFETLRDVLQEFPSWNLKFIDGNDNYFKTPSIQVRLIQNCLLHNTT